MLSTYSDLKSSILNWMYDRQDLATVNSDFITLCEGDLNRVLRTREQLTTVILTPSNLLINGDFDTDTVWTKGDGWTIAAGVATRTNTGSTTSVSQTVSLVEGEQYEVTFTVTDITGGAVRPRFFGGTVVFGTNRINSGTFTEILTAAAGNTTFEMNGTTVFAGSIDNISLRPLNGASALPDDYLQFRQVTALTNPRRALTLVAPSYMDDNLPFRTSGTPRFFTISNDTILVLPTTELDIELEYYAKIPALSETNTTNWLLDRFPNIYLYGSLKHACLFIGDAERAQLMGAMFSGLIEGLVNDDIKSMYARTTARVSRVTP